MTQDVTGAVGDIQARRANQNDAEAIALAHADSIRSIGPGYYPPDVVEAWGAGLTPDIYVRAMEAGEACGLAFYKANGFKELGRGEAVLMSGRSMPCVFMRKTLRDV